jgi:hypothetical protein
LTASSTFFHCSSRGPAIAAANVKPRSTPLNAIQLSMFPPPKIVAELELALVVEA